MWSFRIGRLWSRPIGLALALSGGLLLAGCRQEEVRVYRVPKEKPTQAAGSAHSTRSRLSWRTPPGWSEQAGGNVRLVRFEVSGPAGQKADVAVLPLVGTAVAHGQIVNMVRDQIGLGPLAEEELARLAQKVRIGPGEGELVEMTSTNAAEGQAKTRVLMAATRQDDTLWLFKMSGPDELVAAQREVFLEFLRSIQFQAEAEPEAPVAGGSFEAGAPSPQPAGAAAGASAREAGASPTETAPGLPQWEVPSGWQAQPPGPLVRARYVVTEPEGRAEVTVTALPGDSGGLLANVNRWRGQVGLPPLETSQLDKVVERFDVPAGQVSLVDMTGTDPATGQAARLIGAVLPRGSQSWFFKLRGDAAVVARHRAGFLQFIRSARLPDA